MRQSIQRTLYGSGKHSGRTRARGNVLLASLLIIIGILTLLLYLPGALLKVRYPNIVLASIALSLVTAGWVIFATKKHRSNPNPSAREGSATSGKLAAWEVPVTVGAILIAGLWGFWLMKSGQWGKWSEQEEVERARAPGWSQSLNALRGGMPWLEIRDMFSKEGFEMRCYGIKPNEGMQPDDTHMCWTIANKVWNIPSQTIHFSFGKDGLRQIRILFPKEQWPAVKSWYDQQDGVSAGTFGRDQGGNIITGKMLKTGLVLTSEPVRMPNIMVLWQSRSILQ